MKETILTLFASFTLAATQAQGVFKIGAVVAFPLGDAGNVSGFGK